MTKIPNLPCKEGGRSPWGTIQIASPIQPLQDGIAAVSTASHGGVKLDRKANAKIPAYCRRSGGWYEEDCEWSIPFVVLGLGTEKQQESAYATFKNWYPREYAQWSGSPVPIGESYVLRREAFEDATKDSLVVICAWGDWKDGVPKGMVQCIATVGGNRGVDATERTFLVPSEEYAKDRPFGFVIDLQRHRELEAEKCD